MKIAAFIKQVPDTDSVQWTPNNNIDRANTDSVLNPIDAGMLEAALDIKRMHGAEITAVSMGPDKAVSVLKEAIAKGIDEAVLLSDSKFIGSDTCATSKVLAAFIREKLPDACLLLFGQTASDGETGQTGPQTAVRLNMPFITNVTEINEVSDGFLTGISETETEKTSFKIKLPAVLCINNYADKPRLPEISGYMRAHDYNYKTYNIYDLKLPENETGIKGSPTYVSKVYRTSEGRNCKMIDAAEFLTICRHAGD